MWTNLPGIIAAVATLLGVIGQIVLQLIQAKRSIVTDKKIDENTQMTKDTAAKVDEVHSATNVLTATASGSYKSLKGEDG